MELEISSEQEFFVDTTTKYLADKVPPSVLRAHRHDPVGYPEGYWTQGAELGWMSLLISEDDGGGSMSGRPLGDLGLVAFQFGRHGAPGPLVSSNVVAQALSSAGTPAQRGEVLPGVVAGELIASWCYSERRSGHRPDDIAVLAEKAGSGLRISGVKTPVESGAHADHFLVTAMTPGLGLTQVLVDAKSGGVKVTPLNGVDLTRRFATVSFDDVEVPLEAVVGEIGGATPDVDRQLQTAIALQLAEMTGAMDKAFEITLEWAFDRYSFGRPLASYQELKHRFADMKLWLEAGQAISDGALAATETGADNAWDLLAAGKAYVGHYGVELVHDCVQIHGGIGVTFDHDLHIYLRRMVTDSVLYGTVSDHRRQLTASLIETARTDLRAS